MTEFYGCSRTTIPTIWLCEHFGARGGWTRGPQKSWEDEVPSICPGRLTRAGHECRDSRRLASDLEPLRASLQRMSDSELLRLGRAARYDVPGLA